MQSFESLPHVYLLDNPSSQTCLPSIVRYHSLRNIPYILLLYYLLVVLPHSPAYPPFVLTFLIFPFVLHVSWFFYLLL
ncbi:hypothetical protein BD770DRAFT_398191 [Pilaira anomala]|nr:hypothetical protein BD770DRAFT_398191 [Pilaira anomala]